MNAAWLQCAAHDHRYISQWAFLLFQAILSANIPGPACKLNAWVTAFTCQWLMGPSHITDVELDDGTSIKSQGVKIERWGH